MDVSSDVIFEWAIVMSKLFFAQCHDRYWEPWWTIFDEDKAAVSEWKYNDFVSMNVWLSKETMHMYSELVDR